MSESILDHLAAVFAGIVGLTFWISFLYNYSHALTPLLPQEPTAQTTLLVGLTSVISALIVDLIHKLGPASAHTGEIIFGNVKKVAAIRTWQTFFASGALLLFLGVTIFFLSLAGVGKLAALLVLACSFGYLPLFKRLQKQGREQTKQWLVKILFGSWLAYLLLAALLPISISTYLWVVYVGLQIGVLAGALGNSLLQRTRTQFPPRWLLVKASSYRDGIEMAAISGNKLARQLYQEQGAPATAKPVKNQANKGLLLVKLLLVRNWQQVLPGQLVGVIFTVFLAQYAPVFALYFGSAATVMWSVNKLIPLWGDWATSEATQRMVLGGAAENAATVKARNYFSYLAVLVGLSVSLPSLLALALQATPLWGLTLLVLSLLGFTAHIDEKAQDLKPKAPRPPVITPDGLVIQPQEFSNYQTWLAEALLVPLATIWQSETLGLAVGALLLGIYVFLAKRSRKLLR